MMRVFLHPGSAQRYRSTVRRTKHEEPRRRPDVSEDCTIWLYMKREAASYVCLVVFVCAVCVTATESLGLTASLDRGSYY